MAKGKHSSRPPAAAARHNEEQRKKRALERKLAVAGCVLAAVVAVALRRTGSSPAGDNPRRHCIDSDPQCAEWARRGDCDNDPHRTLDLCRSSCNVCDTARLREMQDEINMGVEQLVDFEESDGAAGRAYRMIEHMHNYFRFEVIADARYTPPVLEKCRNKNESCAVWSATGRCKNDKPFMLEHCAAACRWCYKIICPLEDGGPYAWGAGAVDRTFKRITTDPYYVERYRPKILSRPSSDLSAKKAGDVGGATGEDEEGGPWVVTLENFATAEECNRLIELGSNVVGFHKSETRTMKVVGRKEVSDLRTSTTAWCTGPCAADPAAQSVALRIANLTGLPMQNHESLQLLKYEEGQSYGKHHDYIPDHGAKQWGVRILTVFLYLNDDGLEGGGTNFPRLENLTVWPKQGKVLVWPNVQNPHPNVEDERTEHQALPVLTGVKFGANAWVHQRDYHGAKERNCH